MPVSTTRRRKLTSRRHKSSDIEEDPSQSRLEEDVDNSDGGRGRSKKTEKKPLVPSDINNEQDRESDEDECIDIANFSNQPLQRAHGNGLRGLSQDWENTARVIRSNWTGISDIAASLADANEDANSEEGLAQLDSIMRNLIDIGNEMDAHASILDDLYQIVAQGGDIDDAEDRYITGLGKRMHAYAAKTSRQKYAKNEDYLAFKSSIYEILHDGAMPPITDLIPKEDRDESDDDEELEIGGVSQKYNCPITLTPLVNPVTSSVCNHSFSAEAIKGMFRYSYELHKCPSTGCPKLFRLLDCQPNPVLAKKVKAWKRRMERQAEQSDEEEIIE